jgi:uncharacterized membrane protein
MTFRNLQIQHVEARFTFIHPSAKLIRLNNTIIDSIMIGLVGLLLVVSHLFAVPVLVLWVRLEKKAIDYSWL